MFPCNELGRTLKPSRGPFPTLGPDTAVPWSDSCHQAGSRLWDSASLWDPRLVHILPGYLHQPFQEGELGHQRKDLEWVLGHKSL